MNVMNINKHNFAHNYGAMLQAYALQQTMKNLCDNYTIVDVSEGKIGNSLSWNTASGAIKSILYKINQQDMDLCHNRFDEFAQKYFTKTNRCQTYEDLKSITKDADVCLVGSDQIWHPKKMTDMAFLQFVNDKTTLASYAASLGISYLPEATKHLMAEWLDDFDYISVRESSAKTLLSSLVEKEIHVNIDPTLLLDKTDWDKIENDVDLKKPYILCYILYKPKGFNKFLKNLHKKTGKDIVVVTSYGYRYIYHNKMIYNAGPQEFLGLIKNADFVISSSFHGVALSIAYEKPFYAVVNPDMPARINDLLDRFQLKGRILDFSKPFSFESIDYLKVNEIKKEEQERSISYLKTVLKGKNQHKSQSSQVFEKTNISFVAEKCTGCSACEEICPTNAIKMKQNKEGFLYPTIDSSKCIQCAKCVKGCHAVTHSIKTNEFDKVYYGWHKNREIQFKSTSGGAFSALSEKFLDNCGVVVGAYFDAETKTVSHKSSEQVPFEKILKSKYVESNIDNVISNIKGLLESNKKIVFCGTPCQCAGMRNAFGYDDNLLLIDFFCHGVPSPTVFKDYLNLLEDKYNDKITDYIFRTKSFGWSQYGTNIQFESGKLIRTVGRCESFYNACMLDNKFLRKSCYTCDKARYHYSDLTIGDFWGINKIKVKAPNSDGISLICSHTAKGDELIANLKDVFNIFPVDKKYIEYALAVKTGDNTLKNADRCFEEYYNLGIKNYMTKYYRKRLFINNVIFKLKQRKLKKFKKGCLI